MADVSGTFTVREIRESDWPCVREAFTVDPDMVRQGNVNDKESALAYIRQFTGEDSGFLARIAADPTDSLLAFAAISIDWENLNGWTFYWAYPRARGQGVTSSLVCDLANFALSDGGLFRLELGYRVNNPGSAGVARNAGFLREGVERQKFRVDGARVDVVACARLATDPWPT